MLQVNFGAVQFSLNPNGLFTIGKKQIKVGKLHKN